MCMWFVITLLVWDSLPPLKALIHHLPFLSLSLSLSLPPPPPSSIHLDTPAGPNQFVKIPAGLATIGKPKDFPSYGWDNEYGEAEVQ